MCIRDSYISDTVFGKFVHARLDPGAENSGKLVTIVRNIAEDLVYRENKDLIIIDAAPGIGCSVIASLNGVDLAVIMIEPTLSGISDFLKIYDVVKFFGIKPFVVINKKDLNEDNRQKIIKSVSYTHLDVYKRQEWEDRVPVSEVTVYARAVARKCPISKEYHAVRPNVQNVVLL